jgi:hypothetical protein
VDAKTKNQKVAILMKRFKQLYEDKYGQPPVFNSNTLRWSFGYLLDDLGASAMPTLEYYFTLKTNQEVQDFLRNYPEINKWMIEDAEDAEHRRRLRELTKKKVEEQSGGSPQSDKLDMQEQGHLPSTE